LGKVGADRYLPIWVGLPEAHRSGLAAQGTNTERPIGSTLDPFVDRHDA
jgi:bifunctional DNase/RNase